MSITPGNGPGPDDGAKNESYEATRKRAEILNYLTHIFMYTLEPSSPSNSTQPEATPILTVNGSVFLPNKFVVKDAKCILYNRCPTCCVSQY